MVRPGLKEARGSDRESPVRRTLKACRVHSRRVNTLPPLSPGALGIWHRGVHTSQQTRRCSLACPVPRLQVIEAQSGAAGLPP